MDPLHPLAALINCIACGAEAPDSAERCPECGTMLAGESNRAAARSLRTGAGRGVAPIGVSWFHLPEMRYQNAYVWMVLFASLDILLTYLVLYEWGGFEVNPVAAPIIAFMGFGWAMLFKYAIIVLVIIICEIVGRTRDATGRRLARWSVLISAFPVLYTFALLLLSGPPALS